MSKQLIESLEERRLLSASLLHGVLTVTGTAGNDVISLSKNSTSFVSKVGNEVKSFKLSAVTKFVVNAGAGNDTVSVSSAISKQTTLNGGDGNDNLAGGSGSDAINGGAGDDTLSGGAGNDLENGGTGNDTEIGGDGNDTEIGGDGTDTESGGNGNDLLEGDNGDDLLDGGDGNDSIAGGAGNDTLRGKAGANLLSGGTGSDHFEAGGGTDVVTDHGSDDDGEDGPGDQPTNASAFGTVSAVDPVASTLTLSVFNEHGPVTTRTLTVTAGTVITANDVITPLASLLVGTKVFVTVSPTDATLATKIVAVGARVEGKVSAVDLVANTITLKGQEGRPDRVFTVSPTANILVGGVVSPLSAVVIGAEVKLSLSALNATVAVQIRVGGGDNGHGGGDGGGDGTHANVAEGAVAGVDAVANTITLKGREGNPDKVFTVTPTTTILVDGVVTPLANLPVGLPVRLTLSPTNATVVTAITAVGPTAEGHVSAIDTVAGTITLAGHEGRPAVDFTLSPTVTVKVGDLAGTLASIVVGADVKLQLAALNLTLVLGVKVDD